MDREVARTLCKWMAGRHKLDVPRIRIGSEQRTTYGSATHREHKGLSVSVSVYRTDTEDQEYNDGVKRHILDTIVHEFAHLMCYAKGLLNAKHSQVWVRHYKAMLYMDWAELVNVYNILACDNLDAGGKFTCDNKEIDIESFKKALWMD